ncbi:hypothetical protein EGW08_002940 [Elysia chlorotica]|uniref:Uncharacterized protein n=1 Tax=Elysia chlorotica TaxID=188477 RepID=A0A3S1BIR5_ELYCH|nr:hypothetical protein EGW08_002940 [Elysia chlorotica]
MLLSMTECLVISWIYGVDRFMKDIQLMTGNKPSIYWKIMWKFVTPIVVLTIWIFNLYQMQRVSLDDYQYPEWAVMVGWSFALISILPLPIYAIYAVIQVESGSFRQRILLLIQPTANFGPSQIEDRERYFQTFNDFDWLRYNAAKNRMDWRTYKKYEAGKDKSSSNIAPDNHLPAVSTEDINILVEKMTSQQKLFLGGMFLEEAGDCQKLIEENNEVLGQVENEQTGHRETRYWDFDESLNGKNGKHTRCYSI